MIDPVRFFHPSKSERVAVVSVDASSGAAGQFVIQVARGKKRTALTDSKMYGPFPAGELAVAHKQVVDGLLGEGYVVGGLGQLLMALEEKNPKTRAKAATRLAWRKDTSAVEPLLKLLVKPKDDVATVVEALGQLGDARAIPAIRVEAEKKLLSRRRAGVEALIALGDKDGLAGCRDRALERLPDNVRPAASSSASGHTAAAIVNALAHVDGKERGITADTLYELGGIFTALGQNGAPCVEAALSLLTSSTLHTAHVWRYGKSVWKRSMTRRDFATFGTLAYRIEMTAREHKGQQSTLKSGYDGETRKTMVFGRPTVDYCRRRSWRLLRRLAKHRGDDYAVCAAEAIVHYKDGDDIMKGNSPATGRSYLLHRVLLGGSDRYVFDGRGMKFKPKGKPSKPTPGVREEAYAALWDRTPRAYVRLLGGAKHSLAQKFALDGILRTPAALEGATHAEVAALLDSDDARIVDLGLKELRRRFDPKNPDLALVLEIAGSAKDLVRNHGLVWLNETAAVWTKDPAWIVRFLSMPHAASRDSAAQLVNLAVRTSLSPEQRTKLAADLLAKVEGKEPEEGAFSAYASVLRDGLVEEAAAGCPIARAIAMVETGSDSAISVGASILAKKPGAYDVLGFSKVLALATHEKAAVRRAAMRLLEGATDTLAKDPSALFGLVESDWDDVRAEALKLLDAIDLLPLGLDGLMGLADSTRVDVQRKAHEILNKAMASVDVHELLARLGQHPSAVTRKYAVEMAVTHLKPGFVRLAKLELLFRCSLFDSWPDRKLKRTVITFLAERGQQDENQAEVAATILGDFVRTQTVDDRERALEALVRIKLKFPDVAVAHVVVKEVGGAGAKGASA